MIAPILAGPVWSRTALPDGVEYAAGPVRFRITALRPDILRVRAKPAGTAWPDHESWAVLAEARAASVPAEAMETPDGFGFRTGAASVLVNTASGQLSVSNSSGEVVHADAPALPLTLRGGGFWTYKAIAPGERFFGLGDKTGPLARNNQAFVLWNTDPLNYQESTDPIYKSIPVVLSMRERACSLLLLDNTSRSVFDFGKQQRDVFAFGAEAGAVDYYVIVAETPKAVLSAYAHLTGLPKLPPLWSLGYQQSRYSYMSADAVREIAQRMRAERIPADAIYLDIDYQDRFRTFTTDPERFPDLPGLARDLRQHGMKLVAITDPQLPVTDDADYAPYRSAIEGDHFVRDDAGAVFQGAMWGGISAYPDFARAATRAWWGGLYAGFVRDGIAGFWNDMNEPYVDDRADHTLPLDMPHRAEEEGAPPRIVPHREVHNVYGMLNSRATYEGLRKLAPETRPFVLTRATFAGGQRYATTWTGDNSATWNHLRLGVAMLLNLGLSGFGFAGADLGGFFGSVPPDLLTRWYQLGAFTPLFRNHAFQESAPREPWLDGEPHVSIRRRFIEERYRLLPYLYTLAEEASRTGVPMMRPMFLEFPELAGAPAWITRDPMTQFMLGHALVIAPAPFAEFQSEYAITLPGDTWFDYWTGARVATPVRRAQALDTIPVFARGGTIIPRQPLVQSTAETPQGALELLVYPGQDCHGALYADAGDGYGFNSGEFLRLAVECQGDPERRVLRIGATTGDFAPWWDRITLALHDTPAPPTGFDGEITDMQHDPEHAVLRITTPATRTGTEIQLRFA